MNVSQLIDNALKSLELEENQRAFAFLSQASECGPAVRDLNLVWAMLFLRLSQWKEARTALERELTLFPDNQAAQELFASSQHEDETITVHNIPSIGLRTLHLRKFPSSDDSVFDQVFNKENYKPLIDLVQSSGHDSEIRTLLDAGANIGCSALYFAKFFPHASMLCVEPDDCNFAQLEKNIRVNQLNKAAALKAGVWNTRRSLKIDPRFRDGREWARSLYESDEGTVPGYSLFDLMQLQHWDSLDILKIDIEGAERSLFADRAGMLALLSRVKFIAIEIHDEFNCRSEIEEILGSASFVFSKHEELTVGANQNLLSRKT